MNSTMKSAEAILLPIVQMALAVQLVRVFRQDGNTGDLWLALFFAWASGYRSVGSQPTKER